MFFVLATASSDIFLEPLEGNTPAVNILFYVIFFFFNEKILNLICLTEKAPAWRVWAFFFTDFISLRVAVFPAAHLSVEPGPRMRSEDQWGSCVWGPAYL